MGEVRERSDLFKDIAEGLIKTESELAYIKISMVKIAYLESCF